MNFDIIIVGAGASGLYAARVLSKAGYSVAIVDGRPDIGGRIQTATFPFAADIGAEFIHGEAPTTTRLVREAGNKSIQVDGKIYSLYQGEVVKENPFEESRDEFMSALKKISDDTTVAAFLKTHFANNELLKENVVRFAEGFDAADTERMSALALKDEWDQANEEEQYRVTGRYTALMKYLHDIFTSKGGQTFLSAAVSEIQWNDQQVTVRGEDFRLHGKKVLISVPVSILQRQLIRFDPPIPKYIEASTQIGYGGVIKFHFLFKSKIWETCQRKLTDMQFIFSDADIPTWWSQHPDTVPMLTGWLGGPPAERTSHHKNDLFLKALDALSYILQLPVETLKESLLHHIITDWTLDPFSLGAYSYATPGAKAARDVLNTPISDTIYFCGEALSDNGSGTVEAALQSGEAAARKILEQKGIITPTVRSSR